MFDYLGFNVDDPANRRRSVYRFVFRTLPDPFLEAMDCPDASQLAPERTESVTALQALATLNDRQMARQAELLAAELVATPSSGRTAGRGRCSKRFWRRRRQLTKRPPSSTTCANTA